MIFLVFFYRIFQLFNQILMYKVLCDAKYVHTTRVPAEYQSREGRTDRLFIFIGAEANDSAALFEK